MPLAINRLMKYSTANMSMGSTYLNKAVAKSVLAIFAVVIFSLSGTQALADTDTQIDVNRDLICTELSGVNYCTSIRTVLVQTFPNNGGLHIISTGNFCTTATDLTTNQIVGESCNRFNSHALLDNNQVIKEQGGRFTTTSTFGGVSCTLSGDYHYTNGQFQFQNSSLTCS